VLYVVVIGIIMALKLHAPDWLGESAWLTWGRIRYSHTQGLFFGWLGNAFLAFMYYAVPRLAGRSITSNTLGWVLFFVWNFLLVLPGWALVQAGFSQPLEWAEFPLPIAGVATLGLFGACIQFVVPLLRAKVPSLYVSAWYILGGLTFTLLAYPVGNVAPLVLPGSEGATFSGLWIHDAVGLFVTPMALAIAYAVIPLVTRQPIFSHFLSMLGFWLLFLVYPLNGTHHYIFSTIPMDAQKGAIVASIYLGADVILVVMNLFLSLRGHAGTVCSDVPLRYVWAGVLSYLVVSLQGSAQAVMGVNRLVHFTDWVIGHSHLAMIGFASFTAIGGLLHVWRRTTGCRYNPTAANWSFWLLSVGLLTMVVDLTAAGLVQGVLWQGETPWIDSVSASRGYWIVRSASGLIILAGFLALILAMTTGPRVVGYQPIVVDTDPVVDDLPPGVRWLKGGYALITLAGVGFFVLSFVVLGLWPNRTLRSEITATRPTDRMERSASEWRGREIYAREGCHHCHSQQVRFTEDDVRRFGPPSLAWEGDDDTPHMWGTRRIGPDLARESGRKSRDWHLAHLWNPRHIVAESNMPGYSWLFDGAAARPKREALDLVDYLESLGRDARLTGLAAPKSLSGMDPALESQSGMFCDCAIPRTPGAGPVWVVPTDPGERDRFARRGALAFTRHCAGCHDAEGKGDGPDVLIPRPRNLTEHRYSDRALSAALWSGRPGSSMPGWSDLVPGDLRGLVAHVQALSRVERVTPLPNEKREKAAALFTTHCAVCHGATGAGDGVSAGRLAPAPTNFREVQPSEAYAEKVLANGLPGTAMPRWIGKLSDDERRLLAQYVRTLYAPRE
jgi:cbb3-type cytochrome oxidase subunit 1/mono/diheme cytochrome c family protein